MADIQAIASAAQRLLDDDGFKSVMNELRDELTVGWQSTQPDDVDGRDQIYYLILALNNIEARLRARVDAAKVQSFKSQPKDQ